RRLIIAWSGVQIPLGPPFGSLACRQMVPRPVMDGFMTRRDQTTYAASQASCELRIGRKEVERSSFDNPGTADPSGWIKRFGALDFTAELAFKEQLQEA